jgi:hypothetical protein
MQIMTDYQKKWIEYYLFNTYNIKPENISEINLNYNKDEIQIILKSNDNININRKNLSI